MVLYQRSLTTPLDFRGSVLTVLLILHGHFRVLNDIKNDSGSITLQLTSYVSNTTNKKPWFNTRY